MRACLAALLLSGCGWLDGHDGTYLLTVRRELEEGESGSGNDEQQFLASLYRTDGNAVLDLDSFLLVGPLVESDRIDLRADGGTEYSWEGCQSYAEGSSLRLRAVFTADLGLEGTIDAESYTRLVGCPDTTERVQNIRYRVTGLKLDATPELRPTGSIAWGYVSGGGY